MKVKHRNVMLPIDRLRPHPDNPRKDVGDVTELAESIKANGSSAEEAMLDGTHECFKKECDHDAP